MKMVELKNVGDSRISVRQVRGFALDPGDSKKVPPATAAHPAVKRYIGRGLELVGASKEEPKAPAPPVTEPPQTPDSDTEPTPDSDEETGADEETEDDSNEETEEDSTDEEPVDETAGIDLREDYLSAPGVTEANVDGLLERYPTLETLAVATKETLCDLGVAKSYTNRLVSWASEQLAS
jgi:hypothetical protein